MEIPQLFRTENLKKLEDKLKEKQPKKGNLKRYVLEVFSQQYEDCGWVCAPETYYLGIKAENDDDAYNKAAAYILLRWKQSPSFMRDITDIHGLENSFYSNKKYQIMEELKHKTERKLKKILGKTVYLKKKKDIYSYIAYDSPR